LTKVTKQADKSAAFVEATQLAGFSIAEAERFFGRPPVPLRHLERLVSPMSSQQAEDLFLARFAELDATPADG
jgi:hypothetical protein